MRISKRVLFLIFLCAFFFVASSGYAAGLRITNPDVKLTVAAGSYASGEIPVENLGTDTLAVRAYLEDWVYKDQSGDKDFLPAGTMPLSASNWITFYPADFKLTPGASQNVRFTVQVPEDAKGGYYSILFFETAGGQIQQLDENGQLMNINLMNRLGALIAVEVAGTSTRSASVEKCALFEKLNDFFVTLDMKNTGNVKVEFSGTFNVLDAEGNVFARGEFEKAYALPGKAFTGEASAQSTSLSPGNYDILFSLDLGAGVKLVREASFSVDAGNAISTPILKND